MCSLGFIQVAHVTPDVEYLQPGPDGKLKMGWAEAQLRTTCNFAGQSLFWNLISGGLSNQIEHHLFPGGRQHAHECLVLLCVWLCLCLCA